MKPRFVYECRYCHCFFERTYPELSIDTLNDAGLALESNPSIRDAVHNCEEGIKFGFGDVLGVYAP